MTTVVFAAHPDDEVLGCGATIAKLSAKDDVHVVFLGEGITAREDARHDRTAVSALYEDARAAAELLGVTSVRFEGLPDIRFDTVPLLDIVWRVEAHIRELGPQRVFTHHPGDLNIDHQTTFRAVLTGTRPTGGCPVNELYAFEIPSSTDWSFSSIQPVFRPNVFVDVTETFDVKLRAMQTYRSEHRAFPHPRSSEALRANAERWGSVVDLPCAEAFELIRMVNAH